MSNDKEMNVFERLFKLVSMISKMVLDGVRDPQKVANHLQEVVDDDTGRFGLDKFALLVDLGIITVPEGYDHATWLAKFKERNKEKFYFYNDDIADQNFPKPSRILKPGDRLRVRAYQQLVSGTTTSEERMTYLIAQGAVVFTGAQGASLVFAQKRDQLPKGKWYASFDQKECLWEDAFGVHRVPHVNAYSDGDFNFDLGHFEAVWYVDNAFLGFSDVLE